MDDPEVQCCVHKGSPIFPILSSINPIACINTCFINIHSNIVINLGLGLPRSFFPVGLFVKILEVLLPSPILTTHLLVLITLTILGEQYKLRSSSLWNLLHSPFSSLLGPNIRLRIQFSNTFSLHSSLNVRDHVIIIITIIISII